MFPMCTYGDIEDEKTAEICGFWWAMESYESR